MFDVDIQLIADSFLSIIAIAVLIVPTLIIIMIVQIVKSNKKQNCESHKNEMELNQTQNSKQEMTL